MKKILFIITLTLMGCDDGSYNGKQIFVINKVELNHNTIKGKFCYQILYQRPFNREYINLYTDEKFDVGDTLLLIKK